MNKETDAIFSSTGRLGVSRRQYDRLYVNGTYYSNSPDEIERDFRRLTEVAGRHPRSISRSIFRGLVVERGYTFVSHIPEDQVDQVHALWGKTFGWERHEVDNLRRRLITSRQNSPSQRDVWLSAIRDNGTIISVAMDERLSIPAAEGRMDLVESTEWRTRDEYAGKGLMTATLAALNAQILSDFQDNPNCLPLIFAECNFQSRSDRAGHGAGFRIPERIEGYPAPQILTQNVLVRDGQPVEEGKLRDFTFMYLPVEVIQNYYNPTQVSSITQVIKA